MTTREIFTFTTQRTNNMDLAKKGYEAYAEFVMKANYRGEPMPAFDILPEACRRAWCASVVAILKTTEAE